MLVEDHDPRSVQWKWKKLNIVVCKREFWFPFLTSPRALTCGFWSMPRSRICSSSKPYTMSRYSGQVRLPSLSESWMACWPAASSSFSNLQAESLKWRNNGRAGVSNHQPHDCLLNCLFRRRSKKTSKLRVTDLCAGNTPVTGEFPAQRDSNAENVSIWWRHHDNVTVMSHERHGMASEITDNCNLTG